MEKKPKITVEDFIEEASELLKNSKTLYEVKIKGTKTNVTILKPKDGENNK